MAIDINEGIEESKINISAQLEYIGICAGELLNSQEAQKNPKLFILLPKASTQRAGAYGA